jgi:tripartite-type tricarboxylate transporter receptor subunit TctC
MVQYPPGGLVDTVARLMAPHLSQALGQSVVVDNKPGAGGLIGTDMASKQAADGYTLLVSHASVHIYATATRNSMPFDPVGDFTHMGMLVEAPMTLLVRAQSPFQTMAQYMAAAKTRPVRYGSSGIGSANHLYGELLKLEGPAPQHDHVPYQGSAPAMLDLMGGQIDGLFDPITTNTNQLKAGTLRGIALTTPRRSAMVDWPPIAEQYSAYEDITGWIALAGPPGLPKDIADKLSVAVSQALQQPEVRNRLAFFGLSPMPMGPEALRSFMQSEVPKWARLAKTANIQPE